MGKKVDKLVSVIVPIYMVEEYLPKCIESIQNQTLQHIEIILVDDGSKDRCGEICEQYAADDDRIVVVHKKNGGLVSARKAGVKIAKGEYIGFVDGDDWAEKEMFETLYCHISEQDADIVLSGYIEDIFGTLSEKRNNLLPGVYEGEKLRTDIFSNFLCAGEFFYSNIQPYIWNKLVRKELAVSAILDVDEEIGVGEDVAAVLSMLMLSQRVVVIPDCNYHYCLRNSSMMWSSESEMEEQRKLQILHRYLDKKLNACEAFRFDRRQLYKYSMNNILTRTFGMLQHNDSQTKLWPFSNVKGDCSYILYGAGNFGRAIYKYMNREYPDMIKLWVDRAYRAYDKMGLPIEDITHMTKYRDCDVLVAVLDKNAADTISENLQKMGFACEKIHWIDIPDDNLNRVLCEHGFE